MPSQICHILAGKRARLLAGVAFDSSFLPAFTIGCQGPDVFAHSRRTRPFALTYARLLHRSGYGSFCRAAAELLIQNPFPEARAWLLGFVTHQVVDRVLHPYIVYRSSHLTAKILPGVTPALYHAFFERILDVLVLKAVSGRKVSTFNMDALFQLEESFIDTLSSFIASTLRKTYPEKTNEDEHLEIRIKNAFSDTCFFYHVTNPVLTSMSVSPHHSIIRRFYDRGPAGVSLLYPEKPNPDVDWLNERRLPWKNPATGIRSTSSVLDLFDGAITEAAQVIKTLVSVLDGAVQPQVFEEHIGNSCLSIQNADGSIAQVLYAEPFDLPAELSRELAAREAWVSGTVDPTKDELV